MRSGGGSREKRVAGKHAHAPQYPWILKQRFATFGKVIMVADNKQEDVKIDSQ